MTSKGIAAMAAVALLAWASKGADCAEQTVTLSPAGIAGPAGRSTAAPWSLSGVTTVPGYAGGGDFALAPAEYPVDANADLVAEFEAPAPRDATGNYGMRTEGSATVEAQAARRGAGGARFRGDGGVSFQGRPGSLFGDGGGADDFSVEFWLWPLSMSEGEIVLSWRSMRRDAAGAVVAQHISAVAGRNVLTWSLANFFAASDGRETRLALSGRAPVVPKRWSHHLLRYDSSIGMLEYLVDGLTESVVYATSTGHERGSPWKPFVGTGAPLVFCPTFLGYADCFRVTRTFVESPTLGTWSGRTGVAISPVVDLGYPGSRLLAVNARWKAEGGSGVFFYYRIAESDPGLGRGDSPWTQFDPAKPLPADAKGRFAQFRLELFPGPRGSSTPTVSWLSLRYEPDLPPSAPSRVLASPGDGKILVRWAAVPEADVVAYVVYYGYAPGEYFGADAREGRSPIRAGNVLSLELTGLANGRTYYVAVVAVDAAGNEGRFSVETSARPSKVAP